jgi:hypothetical protein
MGVAFSAFKGIADISYSENFIQIKALGQNSGVGGRAGCPARRRPWTGIQDWSFFA